MRTESSIIELADKILVKTSRNNSRIGLFDGKSGISFYYYLLNSQPKNFSLAEILIDDVVNRLKIGSTDTSFATGISGISWMLEFLSREGFIEGDPDEIISPLDNSIFLDVAFNSMSSTGFETGTLGYLFYYINRYFNSRTGSLHKIIYEKTIKKLLNELYIQIENNQMRISPGQEFSVFWDLPICLFLLTRLVQLKIYEEKVVQVIKSLIPNILELRLSLHANKLTLLLSLVYFNNYYFDKRLIDIQASLLKEFDFHHMLYNEFRDKSLHFKNGISGIYFILIIFSNWSNENHSLIFYSEINLIKKKILNSSFWDINLEHISEVDTLTSFELGIPGIVFTFSHFYLSKLVYEKG